jgi:hypothetical protein
MAFTEYTGDTTIIGALGTNPAERGLTTQEFKDKFDQFAHEFVAWFNETHLPEVAEKAVVDEHKADTATAHGINALAKKAQESWINATPQNGWVSTEAFPLKFRKNEFGELELTGAMSGVDATPDLTIFTLPSGYRPDRTVRFLAITYDATVSSGDHIILAITTDGECKMVMSTLKHYIYVVATIPLS